MTPFPQLVVNSEQTHFLLRINVATLARRALVASPLILRQVAGFFEVVACHLDGFDGDATCRYTIEIGGNVWSGFGIGNNC